MPITVEWDDEAQTIIYTKITPPLSWEEFGEGVNKGMTLAQQSTAFRAVLVDVREADDIPPSGFVNHARQFLSNIPDVPLVMIGDPAITKAILAPIARLLKRPRQFHFSPTLEGGRALILANNESNSANEE